MELYQVYSNNGLARGHMFEKFLPETTRPKVLIFGMYHHLVDLYRVCSNYTPGAHNGPVPRGHMFNIGLYRENMIIGPTDIVQ